MKKEPTAKGKRKHLGKPLTDQSNKSGDLSRLMQLKAMMTDAYSRAWLQNIDTETPQRRAERKMVRELLQLNVKIKRLKAERRNAEVRGRNAKVRRLTTEIKAAQAAKWEAMPEGSFWGDVVRMGAEYISDKKRIESTDRLLSNYFKKPIYPRRWAAVIREIGKQADLHRISLREEFRRHERSTLHAVAPEAVGRFTLEEEEKAIRSIRSALNKVLTEDILGLEWRQNPQQQEQEFVDERQTLDDHSKLELSLILRRKELTEREVRLFLARLEEVPHAELASQLGIQPGAVRTAYHRAIRKLEKLVS